MVDDIAGVAVVLLTRFTSRVPVSSQRSTVTTYCAKSIELGRVLAPKTFLSSPVCRYLLNIDLSAGLNVGDDQPESWWRCKWSPVLLSPSVLPLRRRGEDHWIGLPCRRSHTCGRG